MNKEILTSRDPVHESLRIISMTFEKECRLPWYIFQVSAYRAKQTDT